VAVSWTSKPPGRPGFYWLYYSDRGIRTLTVAEVSTMGGTWEMRLLLNSSIHALEGWAAMHAEARWRRLEVPELPE
jgi:hypothetical protein